MVVPNWLLRETFMVEHNPNCPSPFLVRLVGKGKGYIRRNSDDVRGYGQTLENAATRAMKLAGKFTAVETSAAADECPAHMSGCHVRDGSGICPNCKRPVDDPK